MKYSSNAGSGKSVYSIALPETALRFPVLAGQRRRVAGLDLL